MQDRRDGQPAVAARIALSDELLPHGQELVDALQVKHFPAVVEPYSVDRSTAVQAGAVVIELTSVGSQLLLGMTANMIWDALKLGIVRLRTRARRGTLHVALTVEGGGATRKVTLSAQGDQAAVVQMLDSLDFSSLLKAGSKE